MLRADAVHLPVLEPLALIDATLLFAVQVLLAQHPDLLAPPEVPVLRPLPGLHAARHLLDAIRELHYAVDSYRGFLPTEADLRAGDDIPF
jgi:hypothetical protein